MAAHDDEVDWGVEEEEFDMWATGDGGQQEGNDAVGQDVKGEAKAEHAAIKAEKPSDTPNGTSELPLVLTIHSRSHPGRLYYHIPATGETTWYAPSSPVRMLDMSGMKTPPIPLSERLGLGPSVGMKSELKRVGTISGPSASAGEAAGLFEEDEAEKATKAEPVKSGKQGIPLAQRIGPMVTPARESKSATPAAGAADVARDERAASAGSAQRSGSSVPAHPEQQDIKPVIKEAGRERSRERPSRFGPDVDERTAGEHVRAAAAVEPPRANGQTHSQLPELEDRKPVMSPPTNQRQRSPPHGPRSAGIISSTASRNASLNPVSESGATGIMNATAAAPDARPARWSIKREPEGSYQTDRRRSPPASSAAQQSAASRPRAENGSSSQYPPREPPRTNERRPSPPPRRLENGATTGDSYRPPASPPRSSQPPIYPDRRAPEASGPGPRARMSADQRIPMTQPSKATSRSAAPLPPQRFRDDGPSRPSNINTVPLQRNRWGGEARSEASSGPSREADRRSAALPENGSRDPPPHIDGVGQRGSGPLAERAIPPRGPPPNSRAAYGPSSSGPAPVDKRPGDDMDRSDAVKRARTDDRPSMYPSRGGPPAARPPFPPTMPIGQRGPDKRDMAPSDPPREERYRAAAQPTASSAPSQPPVSASPTPARAAAFVHPSRLSHVPIGTSGSAAVGNPSSGPPSSGPSLARPPPPVDRSNPADRSYTTRSPAPHSAGLYDADRRPRDGPLPPRPDPRDARPASGYYPDRTRSPEPARYRQDARDARGPRPRSRSADRYVPDQRARR